MHSRAGAYEAWQQRLELSIGGTAGHLDRTFPRAAQVESLTQNSADRPHPAQSPLTERSRNLDDR
jgi:hypothetical protein